MRNKIFSKIYLNFLVCSTLVLTSCSGYKSSWDCPKVKGIGCSSINYADEMAREQILLNTMDKNTRRVLINQDALGEDLQEIVINN